MFGFPSAEWRKIGGMDEAGRVVAIAEALVRIEYLHSEMERVEREVLADLAEPVRAAARQWVAWMKRTEP